jgi:hypothetical protein
VLVLEEYTCVFPFFPVETPRRGVSTIFKIIVTIRVIGGLFFPHEHAVLRCNERFLRMIAKHFCCSLLRAASSPPKTPYHFIPTPPFLSLRTLAFSPDSPDSPDFGVPLLGRGVPFFGYGAPFVGSKGEAIPAPAGVPPDSPDYGASLLNAGASV